MLNESKRDSTTEVSPVAAPAGAAAAWSLPVLDRLAIAYLTLPLVIFIGGWFQLWVAVVLLGCVAVSLAPLLAPRQAAGPAPALITPRHLTIALLAGGAWTMFGGTGHLIFANADWHIRDAVLHDLVASPWPVGYGALGGQDSVLRAPVAYFLPAAVVGKWAGLSAAHWAMALWTAMGVSLFLLQVMSLTPARAGAALTALTAVLVVVFFSGLDIVGTLINYGPRFRDQWNIAMHLEWWAGNYQYSSMTTQLFWVPNHALGGWLTIGLLCRDRQGTRFDANLPIVVVAAALWSPLTALGVLPFVLWKAGGDMLRERSLRLFRPAVWAPSLIVGLAIAGYLTLDSGAIPRGWSVGDAHGGAATNVVRQMQFFLLEAGLIGFAILAIRRCAAVGLALVILALLPLAHLGPFNDLVMRASIPSLTVLAIGASTALLRAAPGGAGWGKKLMLGGLLAVGAITPVQEFARAFILPSWPINLNATLVGASCGGFPPHYVARLGEGVAARILRRPHALALGPQGPQSCTNPAAVMMRERDLFL